VAGFPEEGVTGIPGLPDGIGNRNLLKAALKGSASVASDLRRVLGYRCEAGACHVGAWSTARDPRRDCSWTPARRTCCLDQGACNLRITKWSQWKGGRDRKLRPTLPL